MSTDFARAIVWTLALNLPVLAGGYLASATLLHLETGLDRFLAGSLLAWTWITLGLQILGSVGLLEYTPLLSWSCGFLVFGLAAAYWRRRRDGSTPKAKAFDRESWSICATLALGAAIWACISFAAPSLIGPVKVVSDGPIYHLYFAARWWQEGKLFLIAAPFGESAATYFPAGGDLWFTWLFVGFGGDSLAKVGQAPFLLLACTAVYSISRRIGSSTSSALVAASWFAACTPLLIFSFEANVDTTFIAGYLLAVDFLMRFDLERGDSSTLALSMLALGCSLGVKPTALVFAPLVYALALIVILRARLRPRRLFACLLIVLFVPLIPSGFWFGRNLLLTGNPLYPMHLEAFGKVVLSGWYPRSAMHRSPYFIPMSQLRAFGDLLSAVLDARLVPVWLASILIVWLPGKEPKGRREWARAMAILAVLNILAYWMLIPYRTQQRFMLHGVGLAAALLGLLFDRSSILKLLGVVLLIVHISAYSGWPMVSPGQNPPWDLDPSIPNAMPALVRVWSRSGPDWRSMVFGASSLVVALAWSLAASRPSRRALLAALLVSLPALGVVLRLEDGKYGNDPRTRFYPASFPDYYRGWLALDRLTGPKGAKVAYSGTDLPYYLLGAGFKNKVRYININAHHDWLMHDFAREASHAGKTLWDDPRPGWDRLPERADYEAWIRNMDSAGVQFLVVTRANPSEGRFNVADASGFPIERNWAELHPKRFEPVYGAAEGDRLFRIYRINR